MGLWCLVTFTVGLSFGVAVLDFCVGLQFGFHVRTTLDFDVVSQLWVFKYWITIVHL